MILERIDTSVMLGKEELLVMFPGWENLRDGSNGWEKMRMLGPMRMKRECWDSLPKCQRGWRWF